MCRYSIFDRTINSICAVKKLFIKVDPQSISRMVAQSSFGDYYKER